MHSVVYVVFVFVAVIFVVVLLVLVVFTVVVVVFCVVVPTGGVEILPLLTKFSFCSYPAKLP